MSGQWWNDDEVEGQQDKESPANSGGYSSPFPPTAPPPLRTSDQVVDDLTVGPMAGHGSAAKGGRNAIPIGIAIAAVVGLIGGLLVYSSLSGTDSSEVVAEGEIFLERADETGADPFFDEYETLVSFDPSDVTPPGAASIDTAAPAESAAPLTNAEILALSFKGNEPGLYGGTGNNATCNKAALIAFLETNPAKAQAWAGAQGIGVGEIRSFVEDLTTVVLLADTRVTNHGFRDGVAYPLQSVLQAGMAVMIDAAGTPRVKCGCGNPLKRPIAQSRTVVLKGDPWAGFDQGAIATVEPAETVVDTFVLRSTDTGDAIERPAGTSGEADVVTSLAAPRPTDELAVGAAAAVANTLLDAGESEGDPENATPESTVPESTVPSTSPPDTAPQSTLPGTSYCEKYQSYIVEGLERFRDTDEPEGSSAFRSLEEEWYAFLLSAIRDLSASSPAEIQDDWAVIVEIYGSAEAEGSFNLYSNVPRLATAEDRVVAHGENSCGLTF